MTASAPQATATNPALRLSLYAAAFLLPLAFFAAPDLPWESIGVLGGSVQIVISMVAAATAMIALVRFHAQHHVPALLIGLGFIGKASFALFHASVLTGLFLWEFETHPDRLLPWSVTAASTYVAAALVASQLGWDTMPAARMRALVPALYTAGVLVVPLSWALMIHASLPALRSESGPVWAPWDFLPGVLLVAAIALALRRGDWKSEVLGHWLVFGMALKAGSFLFLRPFSETFGVPRWEWAELFNVAGNVAILAGLLGSVFRLYRTEAEQRDELARRGDALASREREVRTMVDHAPYAIISSDAAGRLLEFNPLAAELFGLDDGTRQHTHLKELFRADLWGPIDRMLRAGAAGRGGGVLRSHVDARRTDGAVFPVALTLGVYDGGGRRVAIAFVQDLTESRRQEKAVEDALRFNRAILANAPIMIWATGHDGRIRTFNEAAQSGLGYSPDEVLTLTPDRFILPAEGEPAAVDRGPEPFRRLVGAVRGTAVDRRECTLLRKDESRFPAELAIAALDPDADDSGYVFLAADTTRRHELERMKSEFVSMVSHELRTPLTSIRGALGMLIHGRPQLPEAESNLLEIAQRNVERLILLISDLLDVDKLSAGKMKFEFARLDLDGLVEGARLAAEGQALSRNIRLVHDRRAPGTWVHVDGGRLTQVLTNLLSNAIKFSPDGETVEIGVTANADHARVEIHDHGAGIPAGKQGQMFQKFFQAESSDRRRHGGTGLGLVICKSIVEHMSGRIGFVSNPGHTTFWFELPRHAPPAARASPDGAQRVLVCEDDPDAAGILARYLEHAGFTVDVAADAMTAKRLLRAGDYACMTLDILLPDQNGLSLLAELRESDYARDLPVIVASVADAQEAEEMVHLSLPVSDWQTKPIDEQRLVHAVRKAIAGRPGAQILHVEDDDDMADLVRRALAGTVEVERAPTFESARRRIQEQAFALVLLDILLPDGSGYDLLPVLAQEQPDTPVLILSVKESHGEAARQVAGVLRKQRLQPGEIAATVRRVLRGAPTAAGAQILLVEDDNASARLAELLLKDEAQITRVATLAEARTLVERHAFSLILLDVGLPDGSGYELVPLVHRLHPETAVLLLTGAEGKIPAYAAEAPILRKSDTANHELVEAVRRTLGEWRRHRDAPTMRGSGESGH